MVFITNAEPCRQYGWVDGRALCWRLSFLCWLCHGYETMVACSVMFRHVGSLHCAEFFSIRRLPFFGDSGAQTIGFLIAAIAIIYNPPDRLQTSTWFMPILLLGVPIFDTVLVIISRFRRHLHFYDSGTDHTYHLL